MFSSESAFASMQADSENWMLKFANCGFEQSIWSLDGIRYAASGNPKTIRACPNCGQRSTHPQPNLVFYVKIVHIRVYCLQVVKFDGILAF